MDELVKKTMLEDKMTKEKNMLVSINILFVRTDRDWYVQCKFTPSYTCRITVNFGALKDENILVYYHFRIEQYRLSSRNLLKNDVNTFLKWLTFFFCQKAFFFFFIFRNLRLCFSSMCSKHGRPDKYETLIQYPYYPRMICCELTLCTLFHFRTKNVVPNM